MSVTFGGFPLKIERLGAISRRGREGVGLELGWEVTTVLAGGVVSGGLFRGKRGSSSDGACARLSSVDGLRGWMRFVPRMCGAE